MNTTSNAAAATSSQVTDLCVHYAGFVLTLAKVFLILALLVALIETALLLWAKWEARKAPVVAEKALVAAAIDPIGLINAVKALLEALKGLPAWIAIFLAGLALLWLAATKPEACTPPAAHCLPGGSQKCAPQGATPPSSPTTSNTGVTNTQATSNTQGAGAH
jgi:hypothetical protein